MTLTCRPFDLKLAHTWAISSNAATGGKDFYGTVHVELADPSGQHGFGETAPSSRYAESVDTVLAFLRRVDPARLSFDDLRGSLAYLDELSPQDHAAKTAVDLALHDGAAQAARQAVCDFLGLGFREGRHLSSFTIGVAAPDKIQEKVRAAERYPVLKLKVGTPHDHEIFAALRAVAPTRTVRGDANEGWKTKEDALRNIEWLAGDGHVEFIEQPMPDGTPRGELRWLKERSPLPLFADESYHSAEDLDRVLGCYHGVNVKLVKTGGLARAKTALEAARRAGLKTMIGCMIESSLLISAAAHLAELADYLDIDGSVLITNDPFDGVRNLDGRISFADVPEPYGLRCRPRAGRDALCASVAKPVA